MVTMRIKNKYELAFRKLLRMTENEEGIPKEIVVSKEEGESIIREMNELAKSGIPSSFRVVFISEGPLDFMFEKTIRRGDLLPEQVYNIVNKWATGKLVVRYMDVPVYIEQQKVAKERKTRSWWNFIGR